MTICELLKMELNDKNVLIIGCPASGKTYLSKLFNTSHKVIHTDDYIHFGYVDAMYAVLDDIVSCEDKTIVEGVQGYRLLRKGIQLDCYYPDLVVQMVITEKKMLDVYRKERDKEKAKYLAGFNKMHEKILKDYLVMQNARQPIWIVIENEY